MKSAEEIKKILTAYDLTGSLRDAGELATTRRAVAKIKSDCRAGKRRVPRRPPVEMLAEERARLHPVTAQPHTVAFGTTGR